MNNLIENEAYFNACETIYHSAMDESAESIRLMYSNEIKELEKKHNCIEMDLIGLDYEEITDYYNLLKGK